MAEHLPAKMEQIVFCELTETQKRIYQRILDCPDFTTLRTSWLPCDCGVNAGFFEGYNSMPTREAKVEYYRKWKESIVLRKKCCYQLPAVRHNGEVDPDHVLWRRMHEDAIPCDSCPTCTGLPCMNVLYKASTHAALLQASDQPKPFTSDTDEHYRLDQAKLFLPEDTLRSFPGGYVRNRTIPVNHFELSGKMKALAELLQNISRKHPDAKILVFSVSTKTLDLIEDFVSHHYTSLRMDGKTPDSERRRIKEEFNSNPRIKLLLLSTRAMGTGLNLSAANFVIIFEPDWNPAIDAQAQDRSYRLGQLKDVTVFRLIARGTIEELKFLRQIYKTTLTKETMKDEGWEDSNEVSGPRFRGVAGDKSRKGELFGIANLLKFKDGTFMKYGEMASSTEKYARNVFQSGELVQSIQNQAEETEALFDTEVLVSEEIGNDDRAESRQSEIGEVDLEGVRSFGIGGEEEDDDGEFDDSHVGLESQLCHEIAERQMMQREDHLSGGAAVPERNRDIPLPRNAGEVASVLYLNAAGPLLGRNREEHPTADATVPGFPVPHNAGEAASMPPLNGNADLPGMGLPGSSRVVPVARTERSTNSSSSSRANSKKSRSGGLLTAGLMMGDKKRKKKGT